MDTLLNFVYLMQKKNHFSFEYLAVKEPFANKVRCLQTGVKFSIINLLQISIKLIDKNTHSTCCKKK